MRYLILISVTTIIFSLLFVSCDEDSVTNSTTETGSREYTWTIDTLKNVAKYGSFAYICGSNPQNVWCAGHGELSESILHYKGEKWKLVKTKSVIQPWSIAGISDDEFILGAEYGEIWKYSRGYFSKFGSIKLDGYTIQITGLWVNGPEDIYASGGAYKMDSGKIYGIILHYDGGSWRILVQPKLRGSFLYIKRGSHQSNKYYMKAIVSDPAGSDSSSIIEYDGTSNIKVIKENTIDKHSSSVNLINGYVYFLFDKKLHSYNRGRFEVIKDFSATNISGIKIFGRNLNDFFVQTSNGIGHYNGSNLETLVHGDYVIMDGIVFEKEVFLLCLEWGTRKYYVIHGKLKNEVQQSTIDK